MKQTPIIPIFSDIKSGKLKEKLLFESKVNNKKEVIKEILLEGLIQGKNKDLKKYLKLIMKNKSVSKIDNSNKSNIKYSIGLYDKIKLGSLDYLNYKELEKNSNKRDILFKKQKLFQSKYFEIGKDSFSFRTKSYSNTLEAINNNSNRVLPVGVKSKICLNDKNSKRVFLTENTTPVYKNNIYKSNTINNSSINDCYSFTPNKTNRINKFFKSSSITKRQIKLMKNKKRILYSQNSKEILKLSITSSNNNSDKTISNITNILTNKTTNINTINNSINKKYQNSKDKNNKTINNNSNRILLKNTFKKIDIPFINLTEIKRPITPFISIEKKELLAQKLRKKMQNNITSKLDYLNNSQITQKEKLKTFLNNLSKKKSKKYQKIKANKDLNLELNEILDYNKTKEEKEEEIFKDEVKTKSGFKGKVTSKKAKMIIWSDRINKMNDNQPLLYSGNICKEYDKYSRNAGIGFITLKNGFKYDLNNKKIELINQKMRKKLINNCNKIITLNFTIGQKKIQLVKRYDKDIQEGKNY